jgi:hypothetical protein
MTQPPTSPALAARDHTRTAFALAGAVLVVLVLVLALHGPRFTTSEVGDDGATSVTCGSLLTVGWPTDGSFVSSENSRVYGDHVRSGNPDFVARDGIARDCSERRDTYLALMVLMAVPASVCLSAALARRPAQPA